MQTLLLERFAFDGPAGRLTGWISGSSQEQSLRPVLFIHPINLAGICWGEVVSRLERQRMGNQKALAGLARPEQKVRLFLQQRRQVQGTGDVRTLCHRR